MKHIIVIQTPDVYDDENFIVDRERFEEIVTTTVQALSDHFAKVSVVDTAFYEISAIDAVLRMYGSDSERSEE